ncbi:MAG: family 78 glycoside hydrolase catalytic domain [Lachnospiraceae bacterium]
MKNDKKCREMLRDHFIQTDTPYREGAVDVLEQEISVPGQLQKAVLYITALGVYEAQIDGTKIGEILFAPGYTYYPRELQVNAYDITGMLQGRRARKLRVFLGQGWYCGRYTFDNRTQIYGKHAAVSWILFLTDADGKTSQIVSAPETVQVLTSPYEYAGLYDGEVYHADWLPAPSDIPVIASREKLPEHFDEPLCFTQIAEEMPVRSVMVREGESPVTILDFGQNFAGFLTIHPEVLKQVPAGTRICLRHGEILRADGSLYTANLRKAKAQIIYYTGENAGVYTPRFTYMGFRYAELSGVPYTPGLIQACSIHAKMRRTGFFTCGNRDVGRIYQNQLWSHRSNYIEVPTDCPQRDERMGYTGDCQAFAPTACYNYDVKKFLEKFLRDIRYTQQDHEQHYVAPVVPAMGPEKLGMLNMLGWGDAVTILPDLIYRQYGDPSALAQQYESMKAHVECIISHMGGFLGRKNLWIGPNLGDWLAPGKDVKYMAMHNGPVSNAFVIRDLQILVEAAEMFDHPEDEKRYAMQLAKTNEAYRDAFVSEDGRMSDDYQGAYVMALALVIDEKKESSLWKSLYETLREKLRSEGIATGFYATGYLLPMLARHGDGKLAYDLLLQKKCPGWMYQVKAGATTIWERWDSLRPDGTVNETKMKGGNMVSFNHYAFGSVGRFFYEDVLGIQAREPGFAQVRIAPCPDRRLGSASGSYESVHGRIAVSWAYGKDGSFHLDVEVPVEAVIHLPNGRAQDAAPGRHSYDLPASE